MLATGRGRHQEEDGVSRFTQKKVLAGASKTSGTVRIAFGRRRSAVDKRDVRQNREAAERMDRITREGYRTAVDQAFEAQKSGMRLSRRFFENWVETLDDHAELNRRTFANMQELVREQREVFRELSMESVDAYDGFLDSLDVYQQEISRLDNREY